MKLDNWKTITPYTVAKKMRFDAYQDDWHYDAQDPSMAARQTEGVAGLWNILAKHALALLADEVGMGKTYQAIGVILHLWHIKPDAKILIMVPNKDICLHWIREYKIFLKYHYRGKNANICNANKDPVHEARMFTRLYELEKDIRESAGNLYLTTIHSLSGLVPLDEKDNALVNAERYAAQLHANIKASLGEQGFDLIVIDEAHYFRNRDGQSQRAAAAKSFFGEDDERLGQRTLLLSATPNHSSSRNVADIFSYFIHPESVSPDSDVKTLLKTFAIRRLRKMQGQGITNNKYNYRNERVTAASFVNNPDAELFFALYQKELVNALGEKGENRQFQYGYLEGFESTGIVAREDNDTEMENADEMAKDAFHRAPDSDLLTALTKEFQHIYDRFPDHPKYDTLAKQCIPEKLFYSRASLYSYKHLVFVRRIPSVREITQRINAEYDEVMAKEIISAWGVESPDKTLKAWRKSGWSRKYLNRLTQVLAAQVQQDEIDDAVDKLESDENDDRQLNELKLSSKIADLFVAKTSGIKRTDCTNVSQRFRRPENLFSLFLEPAADYFTAEYHTYYRVAEQQRDSFSDAARDYRRSQWIEQQTPLNSANTSKRQYNQPLKTVWGMMFPLLPEHCQQQIQKWHRTNPAIVENLGSYLKAGYVFASPVMIELYCWYTRFSRNNTLQDVQERYRHFTDSIADKLPGSLLLRYFINGIETFEAMCEKITDHKLDDWTMPWRELTSLSSPAWYASGETDNRQRLILGFNSPFYPNVLVATSVFQEGVNLHLQCNQVHHYGIAWTPGDNEQRVGRIDRLFGRVNHLLKEQGSTELGIHYPYLAQSLDQDQLAAFILHKRNFEAKLDACDFEQFSRDINLKDNVGGWEDALRKPQVDLKPVDPYPVSLGRKRASSKDHNRG
ncbi:DEAD/DEAH box helicase family protein [Pectobacterium parvum]|uniref:DEAD/DEAH box helicase n=1 Tax=Pectobacterium TaxID=122277 RepID=UPI0013FE2527|nr:MULTISPECIES: DEAD/DEAH box helicase [Pectobacterium]UFK38151.1 DEAD/DEAH box helicase family protein [Pectobacterium parvum]